MSKRSLRRHHLARMKAKARRLYRNNPKAAYYANHLTACSCMGCGNPRRWFLQLTMQERRFADRAAMEVDGN